MTVILSAALGIRYHDGYTGAFSREQSPLADIPNGARVRKIKSEDADLTPTGTEGYVLGSLGHKELGVAYYVEWDNRPRVAVAVVSWKIEHIK